MLLLLLLLLMLMLMLSDRHYGRTHVMSKHLDL